MKIIAMIPARMGSQRIPKKNIRLLGDKPLIQYPIDLCLKSNLFDEVWINTESEALGRAGEKFGARFHKRPEELASNNATNREFTYEFLKNHICEYVVMANPTSPLIRAETLAKFLEYLKEGGFDTMLSVAEDKTETFFRGNPVNFSMEEKLNSQFIEPVARNIGALMAWKRKPFIERQEAGINPIFAGSLGLFPIPKDEAADIDTEEDWNIAKALLLSRSVSDTPQYFNI